MAMLEVDILSESKKKKKADTILHEKTIKTLTLVKDHDAKAKSSVNSL